MCTDFYFKKYIVCLDTYISETIKNMYQKNTLTFLIIQSFVYRQSQYYSRYISDNLQNALLKSGSESNSSDFINAHFADLMSPIN